MCPAVPPLRTKTPLGLRAPHVSVVSPLAVAPLPNATRAARVATLDGVARGISPLHATPASGAAEPPWMPANWAPSRRLAERPPLRSLTLERARIAANAGEHGENVLGFAQIRFRPSDRIGRLNEAGMMMGLRALNRPNLAVGSSPGYVGPREGFLLFFFS